ncbi:hypothetical protein SBA5_580024 [Candidatus Sulfotelmatomonas gaucii]|uniref:Uncharacterized protein n=1 Tax=Candidatus Sulfuritelmatomonas gaucii TaxID=2043161 RepID=A0A2N9LVG9_9BACT|nr:hypothetical protein SBA5_580024 [Candidatus Sulfotelmatomonas gaucii]
MKTNNWALNSAVECHLHTVEVAGSNPAAPTIFRRSDPEAWVTERTGQMSDTFPPFYASLPTAARVKGTGAGTLRC